MTFHPFYRQLVVLLIALGGLPCVYAAGLFGLAEDDSKWQEQEVGFPAFPKNDEAWFAFDAGSLSAHRFFVDLASLSVGGDGVVRYVLRMETQGGARNISFEGIRCSTREWRLYATARRDSTWVKSRNESWEKLRDGVSGRHRVTLFVDYFCPGGVIARDASEVENALRKGGHPDNHLW